MTTARNIFIRELFESLESHQYVALKYILKQPEKLPSTSDFDLLVTPHSQAFIIQFCEQHGLLQKVRMEHVLERRSLFLYFADGSFLKLDLLMDFFLKGWRYLEKDLLLRRSVLRNGVRQCHPLHLFEHVVLYYQLNGAGIPERYLTYFKKCALIEQSLMLSYFSEKYRTEVTLFDDMAYALPELKDSIFRKLSFKSDNQGRRLWGRKAQTALTALRNRIPQTGKIITFSGVDGAGKSTMLHAMAKEIRTVHHRKVVVLRHRPGLLPILSSWRYGRQEAEARATVSLPRQGTNKHFLSSLLRFAYYFTDYLFGQFWVYIRYCLLGYIVIYDRYYFDFIVDPRRSNISIPTQWVKQLWRLLIKPQLNVLLYAPPEEIRRRKQELSQPVIQALTKDYQQLFQELQQDSVGTYQVIQNQDQMRTLHQLMQRYFQTCV